MITRYSIILIALLIPLFPCSAGQVVTDGFISQFVPRSPDSPPSNQQRLFNVYLPPTFFTDPTATFPIVYHLTGFGGNFRTYSETDKQVMDEMLAANQVVPMIIVAPDPRVTLYGASFWVDSPGVNGLFEQYIVQELIPFVDAKYRQKRDPNGNAQPFRAMMGQSMGGYGSLFYGIKHPELFNAYAGDSPTSFWVINTTLATPTDNIMYSFNKILLPGIMDNGGQLLPGNDDLTFGFFAWAAAFSPNPAKPFQVDYPFLMAAEGENDNRPVIVTIDGQPSLVVNQPVLDRWQTFDPFVLLDFANKETIRRQAIYFDAGNDPVDEIIDNVGARYFSLKLSDLNIKNEYVLFMGGHVSCTTSLELNCYRFRTNLQTFSAKFSENGVFADDVRTKITGTMTIPIQDNAVFAIDNKSIVGIETELQGTPLTDITFEISDAGRLEIGTGTTLGGALQVGSPFGKANYVENPLLANHRVNFTLTINGPQATAQIGRQGFLGLGVGIDGNRTDVPNYWGTSSLTNLASVKLNFFQGNFIHNQIASSIRPAAALLALGRTDFFGTVINPPLPPETVFQLSFSPDSFTIAGGGNLAKIVNTSLMHPTVLDKAGFIDQGGIRNKEVIVADPDHLFDEFYGPPKGIIGSRTSYTNRLDVGILASGQMLTDRNKKPLPANALLDDFFAFLQTEPYLDQGTKRAAFNVVDGIPTVGYLSSIIDIVREAISTTDTCTPLSPSLTVQRAIEEGAVGIKLATIGGQQVILRLYDLNPPG